jgi:hypothetical protein
MTGRPQASEAVPYYSTYIDQVPGDDVLAVLAGQLAEALPLLEGVADSMHRYAPGKWTLRETVSHISDCERLFVYRAFWFARGFDSPLPGFDQDVAAAGARANDVSWEEHLEELKTVRAATLTFFRHLPAGAWDARGIASDNPFTVRALAYIAAGHFAHHLRIVRERYLAA